VRGDVARARAARLRDVGAAALDSFQRARIGQTARVLVEKDGIGLCEHYLAVVARGGAPEGALLTLRLTGLDDGRLVGEPA
ncbi:MAG: tRNA (N(6)-L-threonylcarbamoyladenosine(37)-C(2))-methylthiotransferase MtaB, partial [Alphaproteobacteria bacterium]|nr:tRNA (N(6)-L-threonylcarbamoyladenosine(37)-C(2))-methylthiotransferase MtaB [Alphaproteobacteria bacterium]